VAHDFKLGSVIINSKGTRVAPRSSQYDVLKLSVHRHRMMQEEAGYNSTDTQYRKTLSNLISSCVHSMRRIKTHRQ
jgi:hypothetical protein